MISLYSRIGISFLLAIFLLRPTLANAQEKSVRPGINKKFKNPDLK